MHVFVRDLIHTSDMTHSYMCHDLFTYVCHGSFSGVTCLMCNVWRVHVTYVWQDSSIHVTWLIHICDRTHPYVWHDSFIHETWLIHMCDMTHSYMKYDLFICVTWLIHTWNMTYSYVWHDSFILEIWLIHMCDMTHSYMKYDLFICVTSLMHMFERGLRVTCNLFICDINVTWLIHTCDMTSHMCVVTRYYVLCVTCDVWHVTCSYLWRMWCGSFIYVTRLVSLCVPWLNHMCDVTHLYVWRSRVSWSVWRVACNSFICVTWILILRVPWHNHMWSVTHS